MHNELSRFQEYQDLLIKCISENLGFSKGKPIAACVIYKCLLQWRSFEVERTNIFDRIIQTIGSAIEVWSWLFYFIFSKRKMHYWLLTSIDSKHEVKSMMLGFILFKVQENNDMLAYWLSNTSTLLLLLQQTLKATGAAGFTPQRRRTMSTSLFGRMSSVWMNIFCCFWQGIIFFFFRGSLPL